MTDEQINELEKCITIHPQISKEEKVILNKLLDKLLNENKKRND